MRALAPVFAIGLCATGAFAQTLEIRDYLTMPMTGSVSGALNNAQLTRINYLQEEPGGTNRFFVNDLNGPLYIFDKNTKSPTVYLDLNGRGTRSGLFHRFTFEQGFAAGFISFRFDPDYTANGKFYTVHMEEPAATAAAAPDNKSFPGFNTGGYEVTKAITTPGDIQREAVLIEWTDSKTSNATFEGTAREVLRLQLNTRIHPMGDIIFNPNARRGDPEWRVMYIGSGDSGSGEQQTAMRTNPQRLDTLVGKILRIIPDLKEHADSSTVSDNGRYRIPNDNPFKEIWAYGLRNPHRLSWDGNTLIAATVGLHTWEVAYIIRKGANYGYPLREGNETLKQDNATTALPAQDIVGTAAPTYPVLQYAHNKEGGDAISGGFVYRGSALPALRGKYIFGDITTGRVWYADLAEMMAADDGKPSTMAQLHELKIRWNGTTYDTMFPIVEKAYHDRGGQDPDLPGTSTVSATGRADIRFAVDAAGELYILSKSDGVIRSVVGVTSAPVRN
jgi:hypothetical protein